ncbi:hypothetical protein KR093_003375, partial [Drosophila rubida]
CKYSDSQCLVNVINQIFREKADTGDAGLDLVKLEPLAINRLRIQKGKESPINIDLVLTNNNVYGLKTVKKHFRGFSKDLTKRHELRMHADSLYMIGPYSITGKVLVLPIRGEGESNFTLSNVDFTASFSGKTNERDGEIYLEPVKFALDASPERLYYNFTNLFNGDKALGDNMNLFLNENWEPIYREVKPELLDGFAIKFEEIVKKIFSKTPYNKILLE